MNTALIERAKLLLGIKGYYTNLLTGNSKLTRQDIIDQYHNLLQVEKPSELPKAIYKCGRYAISGNRQLKPILLSVLWRLLYVPIWSLKAGNQRRKSSDC